jgi:predicted dehydrogenase
MQPLDGNVPMTDDARHEELFHRRPPMSSLKNILIVGVGSIGLRHLRCFQNTGRARLSFCEPNPALRSQVAAEYHIDRHYASLDEAMADRYDAAVIATPAPLHIPMAMQFAEAGIPFLVEKPLSTTLDGVDALQALVHKRKLLAMVAYVYRANPILEAMRNALISGRFGQPVEILATCGQHFPTYRPAYRDIYYRDRAMGGGAIQDALTHILNAGEWLVGPIDRLVADAAHQVLEGVEVEDTVHVLTRHGRVMGSFTLNQYQAPNETTITVVCEHGTVRYENHECRWRWMTQPGKVWNDEPHEPFERDAWFIRQANVFLDVLEGRTTPPCSLDEGLQTLRVNLAALASAEQATWQTVRP